MKIFTNRKYVDGPWGGGNNFVKNMFECSEYLGVGVTNNLSPDVDIIQLQDLHPDELGIGANEALMFKQKNPNVKIVHRVNDMDLGRYGAEPWRANLYKEFSKFSDATVFVSDWTKEWFLRKGWFCKNNFVVYNGVDKNIYKPSDKIKNGKVNIVTHHWSNNEGKGFDIYEKIDEFVSENPEFTFTYIGRHRNTFKNTYCLGPWFGMKLGKELSKYDVYISASEYENCPNHILESIACGIPTYSLSGYRGAASAYIVGDDFVYEDWDALKKILLQKKYPKNKYLPLSWEDSIGQYVDAYKELINE